MTTSTAPKNDKPVDPEREWLRSVYQPGVPQLTARAVISGMSIGALM